MGTKKICFLINLGWGIMEVGFSENLVEAQFVDVKSGDSWGFQMHSKGVMDADGMDLFNIRTHKYTNNRKKQG
jgi:hypothetical protein